MSFGRQESTTSSTSTQPVYYPGQEAYIPQFVAPFQKALGGDFSDPTMQALYKLAQGSASGAGTSQRTQIAGTPGLSAPARTKLAGQTADKAITAAAGVPGSVWQTALQVLSQYALQAPVLATQSQTSGGGGFGVGVSLPAGAKGPWG